MADNLDGKVYPVGGAALTGLQYTLTDASDATPTLVDAAISLRIFALTGTVKITTEGVLDTKTRELPPTNATPDLTLTVGSGLTRTTNGENSQVGDILITKAQLTTLLGSAVLKAFSYTWVLTPVGVQDTARPLGDGYDGVFALGREGYSLDALRKAA